MLLKFAFMDFIDDREFNNSSKANIKNHKFILGGFIEYMNERDVLNIEDVTTQDIKDYFKHRVNEKGDKPGTINTRLQRIRAFFNYCIESDYIKKSPAEKVKRLQEDVRIAVFKDEHIYQILGYYRRLKTRDKRLFAYRDCMLIVFLLSTGFRRTETINLKWSDVDLENKTINVFGKNRTLESIVITDKLAKELASYYMFLSRYFKDKPVQFVFTDRYGNFLTQNAIRLIMRGLSKKMNFSDVKITCHVFRHTFCHRLVTSGMTPFAVQGMMRHKNINVTMRYVAMWGEELRKQNDEYNPLNNLNI